MKPNLVSYIKHKKKCIREAEGNQESQNTEENTFQRILKWVKLNRLFQQYTQVLKLTKECPSVVFANDCLTNVK